MTSYNGFSPEQRNRAQAWLNQQWRAGTLPRPAQCCACGQEKGVIDAHAEDYSEPFGDNLTQFPMCFFCHMMIHCRFRAKAAWDQYRAMIRSGVRVIGLTSRNFGAIQQYTKGTRPRTEPCQPSSRTVLDDIDAGLYQPTRG